MAKLTVTTIPPVKPVKTYTLELNQAEANALIEVLARIGGSPHYTARKYTQQVADALYEAGVGQGNLDNTDFMVEADARSIYFTEGSLAVVEHEG